MKTIPISKKELVMALLRDHLVSYRLVQGLLKTGLDSFNFDLYTGDIIFQLMGFGSSEKEEELFEEFLNWSEKVMNIDFLGEDRIEPLNDLRDEIYSKLKKEQKLRKLKKY
ncbi:MAG: hypothetical protein ACT4ON_05790 [Bacteroidota bacterium]